MMNIFTEVVNRTIPMIIAITTSTLLVDRRRRKTAELRRTHGAGLRDAFLDALAVHLEPDFGLGDNDNSITHNLVGEGIGIEANLVLPVGRNGRVHIRIERRGG